MGDITISDRWWGAVCYLSALVIVPICLKNKSEFLAQHCRQGFALFFGQVVLLLVLLAIEGTIGRIPILGFLLSMLLFLVYFLLFLGLAAIGCMRALSGEEWRIPVFDDLAQKVPIP